MLYSIANYLLFNFFFIEIFENFREKQKEPSNQAVYNDREEEKESLNAQQQLRLQSLASRYQYLLTTARNPKCPPCPMCNYQHIRKQRQSTNDNIASIAVKIGTCNTRHEQRVCFLILIQYKFQFNAYNIQY